MINQSDLTGGFTIGIRMKINRTEQSSKSWMGIFGNHLDARGFAPQFNGNGTTLGGLDYVPYYENWVDWVYSFKDGELKTYANGNEIASGVWSLNPYSGFFIGNSYQGTDRAMKGSIACFKIWKVGLTGEEIKYLNMADETVEAKPDKIYYSTLFRNEEDVKKLGTWVGSGYQFIDNR